MRLGEVEVTSFTWFASTFAMNSLYEGVCSRVDWPSSNTSCQRSRRSTIASQNKIVFAVELEFTVTSQVLPRSRLRAYFFPRPRSITINAAEPRMTNLSGSGRSILRSKTYPTHISLDAVRNPK